MEGFGSPSSISLDGEGDDNNDSRHITFVLLWEDGGIHAFKFYKFSVCWLEDRSGSDKRQI